MNVTRLRMMCFGCWIMLLLAVAITPQQISAQVGWGDRSFDTSSTSNVDRRWEGGWLETSPSANRSCNSVSSQTIRIPVLWCAKSYAIQLPSVQGWFPVMSSFASPVTKLAALEINLRS